MNNRSWKPTQDDNVWYVRNIYGCRRVEMFVWDEDCGFHVYRTKEHAEIALKYVKEAHKKAHEEIGE